MRRNAPTHGIGRDRSKDAVTRNWDLRLLAVGFVGAFAGCLYTMFPFAGGNTMPDQYLLFVDGGIGDVEALSKEALAHVATDARSREIQSAE